MQEKSAKARKREGANARKEIRRNPFALLRFSAFALILISLHVSAQEPEIRRERVFTGEGLYGFMNGAADLFLEYGFKSLVNRDLIYKEEAFTVDMYEMPNPENAFGIYSMYVFRCQHADSLGAIDCFSPYQLQAVVDNLYISIVFPSGSTKAQQIAGELIPLFVPAKQSSMPAIPDLIVSSPPFSGIVKYLKGPISVSSASRDLTALLKNVDYIGVWFKPDNQTKTYKAAILFPSSEAMEKFKSSNPEIDIIQSHKNMLLISRQEKESESSKLF